MLASASEDARDELNLPTLTRKKTRRNAAATMSVTSLSPASFTSAHTVGRAPESPTPARNLGAGGSLTPGAAPSQGGSD